MGMAVDMEDTILFPMRIVIQEVLCTEREVLEAEMSAIQIVILPVTTLVM